MEARRGCWVVPDSLADRVEDVPPDVALWLLELRLLRDRQGAVALGWDPRLKIVVGSPCHPTHLLEEDNKESVSLDSGCYDAGDSSLTLQIGDLARTRTLDSLDDQPEGLPQWQKRSAAMDSPENSSDSDRSVDSLEEDGDEDDSLCRVSPHRDTVPSRCPLPVLVEEDEEDLSDGDGTVWGSEGGETLVWASDGSGGGGDDDTMPVASASCSDSRAEAAEALESAEALCRDLERTLCRDDTLSQSLSVDEDIVFDEDFLALCSEASRLAEACLGTAESPSKAGPHPRPTRLDVNAIFDSGGPEQPRPPLRKRRMRKMVSVSEHPNQGGLADATEVALMTRACERTLLKRSRSHPGPLGLQTSCGSAAHSLDWKGEDQVELREPQATSGSAADQIDSEDGSELREPSNSSGSAADPVCLKYEDQVELQSTSERPTDPKYWKYEDQVELSASSDVAADPVDPSAPNESPALASTADFHVLNDPAVRKNLLSSLSPDGSALSDSTQVNATDSSVLSDLVEQKSECKPELVRSCLTTRESETQTELVSCCTDSSGTQAARTSELIERAQAPDAIEQVHRRKGSVSSDVVAWKEDLLWSGLYSDEEDYMESKKWFSSSDDKGRVYFFEENSIESSWNLPDVKAGSDQDLPDQGSHEQIIKSAQPQSVLPPPTSSDINKKTDKNDHIEKNDRVSLRAAKSRSMVVLVDSCEGKNSKTSPVPRNWPQLFEGDMCVLKEAPMYRTKITENGKKLRKNWAPAHVVLTELFLLLFRDAKTFVAMKSAASGNASFRPEMCVDLNGALIDQVDRGDKASVTSRKNVFLVSTVLGLQVLFQCECSQQAEEWYNAVHTAIHNLPSGFDSCPRIKVTKEMDRLFSESNSPEQTKKFPRIGRSKSVKIKNKEGSIEDLTVSPAERQTKIRARLKKFFNRRPTMESLVKKGIWKDEPAFGCYLEQVCGNESPRVPLFVQRCITVIEGNIDNMKTDGLYRASGNLSQVQKIRLQVDQNNLSALDQEEDVHVLTGALKLFFRELKEPLIPYAAFSKAIKASTNQNKKEKLAQFRDIVKSLPTANHDTLKFLLKHLLRVTSYQEFNRMHIPNLAIVFGPTLMWPEQESLNMALDLMQQNLVIETFLLDFDNIFR